ncbi:MAG: glycosyltransferase family 2 protein [Desulfopila sp.]|nr:glycosyltransferase family 2 protein [Desulfopila sp.]
MISLIIPTLNGGELFRRVLEKISQQRLQEEFELLVFDSSSTDNTVAVARSYGAEVVSVLKKDFDHGGTRSMAAAKASGDILIFMTQDAVPTGPDVLAALITPFKIDRSVVVTYGRQLPAEKATIAAAHLRLYNYPDVSSKRSIKDKEKYGLKTVFISNSFAAYRKAELAECGYFQNGLIFGEDTCAVGRLLRHGYCISYVAEATIYHSHNYSFVEEFKRYFDIGVLHTAENWLLQEYGTAEGQGLGYMQSAFSYYLANNGWYHIPDLIIRCGMKYCGYRLGRNFKKIPKQLRPRLSMHQHWWSKANNRIG